MHSPHWRRTAWGLTAAVLLAAGCQAAPETQTPAPTAPSQSAAPATGGPSGSPIAEIQKLFHDSGTPVARLMPGTWVMTRTVSRGHAESDPKGIRHKVSLEDSYDWALTFFLDGDGGLRVISVEGDARGEMSEAFISPGEDLTFHAGDGGNEGRKEFRCRSASPDRLVCLWTGHEADTGAVFLKISK